MTQKFTCYIILLIGSFLSGSFASAQGVYVPKASKIFFVGDSAAIFSNVLNEGNFGVGKKAFVHFKGRVWENHSSAVMTDESNGGDGSNGLGGVISFSAEGTRQSLIGGYNAATKLGPAFSSLQVNNAAGVELNLGSVKVQREVILSKGLVHLNGNVFTVGHANPGIISGFDSSRYFVTGTQISGGLLLRENIKAADGQVIFPVGSKVGAYTPAALKSRAASGDDFYITVFDSVKSNITNGFNLESETVNKTWQIGKMFRPGEDEVEISLQHLNKDEGSDFFLGREQAFISQYTGSDWDKGFPQSVPGSGHLTTSSAIFNSGVNSRVFQGAVMQNSYFTKLAGPKDTSVKTRLLLGAYRVDNNLVRVNWQTNPEVNVRHFVVERKLSNQTSFVAVDTISSLSANTVSLLNLFYGINDPNSYKGISFYRLKIVERSNSSYYSNIVAVSGAGNYMVVLWPNPAHDKFNLIINSPQARAVVIYNNLGQLVWRTSINANAQTFMEIKNHGLLPGTYFVNVLDQKGNILETEKLLIVDK